MISPLPQARRMSTGFDLAGVKHFPVRLDPNEIERRFPRDRRLKLLRPGPECQYLRLGRLPVGSWWVIIRFVVSLFLIVGSVGPKAPQAGHGLLIMIGKWIGVRFTVLLLDLFLQAQRIALIFFLLGHGSRRGTGLGVGSRRGRILFIGIRQRSVDLAFFSFSDASPETVVGCLR